MGKLQAAADAATVVLAVAAIVALAVVYWPESPTEPERFDVWIDESIGIDLANAPRTLIMVLDSGCRFCQESMPLYRRLLERDMSDVQIVVAAPLYDTGIEDYLASESVSPDSVVFVESGSLPVSSTPALLLVDGEGLVTHAWIGLLSTDREQEVFDALW